MHYRVRLVDGENAPHRNRVADVGAFESIRSERTHAVERAQIARVGQFVDVHNLIAGCTKEVPDHSRADKPSATGYKYLHVGNLNVIMSINSPIADQSEVHPEREYHA
jgi:hypothetical protein